MTSRATDPEDPGPRLCPRRGRVTLALIAAALGLLLAYLLWSPGEEVLDGRHDLGRNGIWLRHGWLGDDAWFRRNHRDPASFRDPRAIDDLAGRLVRHRIRTVFPHLCPCRPDGTIPAVDDAQTERFLDRFESFEVLPWIGGRLGTHCEPASPAWRGRFAASAAALLRRHPRLAGVHVNVEPLPTGDRSFLMLLEEIRRAIPAGKRLSVAAFPPPTVWHRYPDVHWEDEYLQEVACRADQVVPMLYDTAIRLSKVYRQVVARWTAEVLRHCGDTEVLLGVPAYEDEGVGYHVPRVENLRNAIRGVHAGLGTTPPPGNYAGIAIYCAWEMDGAKWEVLRREFSRAR